MGGKAWVLLIMMSATVFVFSCGKSGKSGGEGNAVPEEKPSMKIAFETTRTGNFDIFSIHEDGTHPVRLTQSPGWSRYPSWSPDGKYVAFSSNRETRTRFLIFLVTPQDSVGMFGLDAFPLAGNGMTNWHLSWSPDGKKIVCQTMRDGYYDLWVVPVDSTKAAYPLTTGPDAEDEPAWSPDGKKIAYTIETRDACSIWVMNADGSKPTRITPDTIFATSPSWSPDSAKLVFIMGKTPVTQLAVMNADGSDIKQLTNDSKNRSRPAWSPDGKKIAFGMFTGDPKNDRDIFTMNIDGSNVVDVTNSPGLDDYPTWSPAPNTAK